MAEALARRSNCFFWAIHRWWDVGGYVLITKSRYGWWPHFMWSEHLRQFQAFVPVAEKRHRTFPPVWFYGRVREMVIRKAT